MDELFLLEYKKCQAIRRLSRSSAHNYNNIFAALRGQIGLALRDHADAKKSERKNTIEELLQRGTVQTDLLYGFTLERECEKRNHSPGVLGNKAVSLLNTVSSQHNFQFVKESHVPQFFGNSHDVVLSLFYIGENSIESMPDGGTITVHLGMRRKHGESFVTFSVNDTGRGFDSAILARAFEPYVTSAKDIPFKGLGLFAVKKMVGDHGGGVRIRSEKEGGTRVIIEFPAAADHVHGNTAVTDAVRREPCLHEAGEPKVILLVDDERIMRKMLIERLERRGHTVHGVSSCQEAVDVYRQTGDTIDCILLDLHLADSQGTVCARRLLDISKNAMLIFMSGINNCKEREEFASSPFLHKPFSIKDLEQIIYHGGSADT